MKCPQLVCYWRHAWKLSSVQIGALLAVLSVLQTQILPLFAFAIPANIYPWVTAILGAAVVVARLIAQPGVSGTPQASESDPGAQS